MRKSSFSLYTKGQVSSDQVNPEAIDNKERTNTQNQPISNPVASIADELSKLAKLRDQGVITEAEFVQMKGNLIKRT
ncbi:MAG: SHOCT domain-containing protein [Nitrososphaeraceae archaeon]